MKLQPSRVPSSSLHLERGQQRTMIRGHDPGRVAAIEDLRLLQRQARRLLRIERVVDAGIASLPGGISLVGDV